MFKSLIDFWKGEGFLKSVIGEFGNMLSDSRDMFKMVCDDILKDKKISVLKDKIYGVDKKINTLEKDIRKRIIEHLSIQPGVDSPMCLLLMSVVKDAERLGDYAKNLYHVSRMTHRPFDNDTFLKLFNGMDETILKMFDDTKKAFIESDEALAKELWKVERGVVKRCDVIIEELSKGSLDTNKAVILTLIARYFKRTAAHLTNIATSVILPISELDFFDEKRRTEE